MNEGGGGGGERLTRPGPQAAWTRRAPRRPSPPPGKGAGPGRARGAGAGSGQGAPRGKGVVYFVRPGRCPGDSVRPRPEHFARARPCARARVVFGVPAGRARSEPRVPSGPGALAPGGGGGPAPELARGPQEPAASGSRRGHRPGRFFLTTAPPPRLSFRGPRDSAQGAR